MEKSAFLDFRDRISYENFSQKQCEINNFNIQHTKALYFAVTNIVTDV